MEISVQVPVQLRRHLTEIVFSQQLGKKPTNSQKGKAVLIILVPALVPVFPPYRYKTMKYFTIKLLQK